MERGLRLSLKSRPRDESEPADALTNGDFSGFEESKRPQVVWNDVDWSLQDSLVVCTIQGCNAVTFQIEVDSYFIYIQYGSPPDCNFQS